MININFDFSKETPAGKDQDTVSPTLRMYNRFLWSKKLPSGNVFELVYRDKKKDPYAYLYHQSELGELHLSCDTMVPSFIVSRKSPGAAGMTDEELRAFEKTINHRIGGKIIFPKNRIDGKPTINQARGCLDTISDRFDLTLECIRRHYLGENSPLADTLERYRDFFGLFKSFRGYVEYFLLQDIVTDDCSSIRFLMPFNDFAGSPVPPDRETYVRYQNMAKNFIKARSARIEAYAESENIAKG